MIINAPRFYTKDYDNGQIWELIATNAYNIRFLLKDRGWTFKKRWGKEKDVWVIENLSPAGLRYENSWIWDKGWKINGGTLEEHKRLHLEGSKS